MKEKIILNRYIFDIVSNNQFNKIFVYGSENLELEKLLYDLTSSPIVGGDVDFCNVLLGKYYSNDTNLKLSDEIYRCLKLNINSKFSNIEKLAFAFIYKSYKPKSNNEHSKRIFNNIINNKKFLIAELERQISSVSLNLHKFKECKVDKFIQDITKNDLLIIDNQVHNVLNYKLIKVLHASPIVYMIISKKEISYLYKNQILKSHNLNIYSNLNLKTKLISTKNNKQISQKSFNIIQNDDIESIEIKQLTLSQFNALRQKYLSKQIHYLGTPKISYGLFANNKLFGAFGLTNDYRNKPPKIIEKPCIYLLSDFVVNSSINKLSKLVLYSVLSNEVKLLAERLLNKEIKTIFTNVFTKNLSSVKYRDLFTLLDRKQIQNGNYNLTYYSQMGKWNLKEGLRLWKQKLLK